MSFFKAGRFPLLSTKYPKLRPALFLSSSLINASTAISSPLLSRLGSALFVYNFTQTKPGNLTKVLNSQTSEKEYFHKKKNLTIFFGEDKNLFVDLRNGSDQKKKSLLREFQKEEINRKNSSSKNNLVVYNQIKSNVTKSRFQKKYFTYFMKQSSKKINTPTNNKKNNTQRSFKNIPKNVYGSNKTNCGRVKKKCEKKTTINPSYKNSEVFPNDENVYSKRKKPFLNYNNASGDTKNTLIINKAFKNIFESDLNLKKKSYKKNYSTNTRVTPESNEIKKFDTNVKKILHVKFSNESETTKKSDATKFVAKSEKFSVTPIVEFHQKVNEGIIFNQTLHNKTNSYGKTTLPENHYKKRTFFSQISSYVSSTSKNLSSFSSSQKNFSLRFPIIHDESLETIQSYQHSIHSLTNHSTTQAFATKLSLPAFYSQLLALIATSSSSPSFKHFLNTVSHRTKRDLRNEDECQEIPQNVIWIGVHSEELYRAHMMSINMIHNDQEHSKVKKSKKFKKKKIKKKFHSQNKRFKGERHSDNKMKRSRSNEQETTRMRIFKRNRKQTIGKKHRNKRNSDSKPSWHCTFEKYWKDLGENVYPRHILTGRCINKHCMGGLYECRAKKYSVNVMRRNVDVCDPYNGSEGTPWLDHSWRVGHFKAVVGCECSKSREAGWLKVSKKTTADDF